ncbi:MAG: hypothetical protein R3E96_07265, partial [Planctomycetota bacterium]
MRTLLFQSLILALCGCQAAQAPSAHRVETQRQAGSFHFSVVAVSPWESSVQNLQPQFQMDEDQALNAVLATTRTVQEAVHQVDERSLKGTDRRIQPSDATPGDGGSLGDQGNNSGTDSGSNGASGGDSQSGDAGSPWGTPTTTETPISSPSTNTGDSNSSSPIGDLL